MGIVRLILIAYLFVACVQVHSAPVDPKKSNEKQKDVNSVDGHDGNSDLNESGLEYDRYLQEVAKLLESDPAFREKLEKSDPEDIRTGKVAKELDYVNHHVRTKLDELKRQELERLRHLAVQEYEAARGLGIPHDGKVKAPRHLDHRIPSFEAEDLRRLIVQTSKDLEEADRKRKETFKEYEMQKEFEHHNKLQEMDEMKRNAEEKAWEENKKKHSQHPKLHHPGSKQQLEEVWEEQDHLSPDSFNPKTFFALHDLDGNGYWDPDEVKALFTKELDKAYDPNAPEDDMAERYEEMERMREHVFNETDTNRDYLISYAEFLEQTRKQEFEQDPGWNTIEQQPVYTHEEYLAFERQRQMEIQRMIDQGLLPPHPMAGHPNAGPHGMLPQPIPAQMPQYAPGQPYVQPQIPQNVKQLTPEEAAKLQQQQYPAYGQPLQFLPQQQYQPGQQPMYQQPMYQQPMYQQPPNFQQPLQSQGYQQVPVQQQPQQMAQQVNQQQPTQAQQYQQFQGQQQQPQPVAQQPLANQPVHQAAAQQQQPAQQSPQMASNDKSGSEHKN